MSNDPKTKEKFSKLKRNRLLVLAKIQGKDVQREIDLIEDELFSMSKPGKYNGAKGLELSHIRIQPNVCCDATIHPKGSKDHDCFGVFPDFGHYT